MNSYLKFLTVIITALIIGVIPSLFAASQGDAYINKVGDQNFISTLQSNQVVVVDFTADWCQPCKKFHPIFAKTAQEMNGSVTFCQVNIDHAPNTSDNYNVRSIPTLILFKNGKEIARKVGGMNGPTLKKFIQKAHL